MRLRIHTTDTMTGEAETHDIVVRELTAQAIADALKETEYEQLEGIHLLMGASSDGAPTSGAFILRGNMHGEYFIAGTVYTQFS